MAYGILQMGQDQSRQATQMLGSAARSEQQHNRMQDQLDEAHDTEVKQTIGTGAGMGLKYGMSEGGEQTINSAYNSLTSSAVPETTVASGEGVGIVGDATGSYAASPVATGVGEAAGTAINASPVAEGVTSAITEGVAADAATGVATDAAIGAATEAAATTAATSAATTAAASTATSAAAGAAGAAGGAEAGATLGSWAGPIGMAGGALIGAALTQLF